MSPITVRQRLQDYEFTDEQEMTLTLELLNRIEKDIEEIKARKTGEGFSVYVAMAGIAATLFVLLGELNKLTEIPLSKVGIIFFAAILFLKAPWTLYQLITLDQATSKQHAPGRFFWSNDFFFEHRPTSVFQLFIFLLSLAFIFFLPIPMWVSVVTGISFLLYVLIIGFIFIISICKVAYRPNNDKKAMIGLPILFLGFSIASFVGLIFQMQLPVGSETQPYIIAGLLLTIVVLIDTLIRLATPSLLLEKLRTLRYDIIFLKANLEDAWTRYEICVDGHEISEELRDDMDDIIRCFNTLDFHQSKKIESLSKIQEELNQLQTLKTKRDLTENDFDTLNAHKVNLFLHFQEINRVNDYLNPRIENLANKICKISGATQEWQQADLYRQYIFTRSESINTKENQIATDGKEADDILKSLYPTQNDEITK